MDYEVIIVGSGPSGISTWLHLHRVAPQLASRTLMLEKEHHPRPKLCAGGVLPDAEICLENLGLDITEVPQVIGKWANFVFEGRGMRMRARNRPYAFRVVRREEFDAWLVGKARERGLNLREGARVRRVVPDAEGVTVETNEGPYLARAVVGADGAKSVVRRAVTVGRGAQVSRLIEVHVPPRPDAAQDAPHAPDQAYLEFGHVPGGMQGYVWDFPTQEQGKRMRCWGAFDSRVTPGGPHASLTEAMQAEMEKQGYTPDDYELQGHPIRWFDAHGAFSAPRVVLVGDAAGIDAAFGEGISPALAYGEIAATALRDAFEQDDYSFADYRQRVLAHPLGRALRRRTFTAKALYGTRSRLLHRLIWRRLGAVLRRYINHFLINWAQPSAD